MRLAIVVGARPNFMKMAPILREARKQPGIDVIFVHTGQHYDDEMSDVFLSDLDLPRPDVWLSGGSGSQAQQTARIMVAFEEFLVAQKADMVMVGGDVNSTLACALVASKLQVPVAHVEAGLRSFDRTMPEEINRVVTDAVSDLLFTTCEDANANLEREGISREKIFFVGNTMIDSLTACLEKALETRVHEKMGVEENRYALVTLHRPSNVDTPDVFVRILDALEWIQSRIVLLFPVHPRTRERLETFGLLPRVSSMSNFRLLPPLGYLEFLGLMARAAFVLTDSGGIQEETTILGVPCLTLRWNTERPVTLTQGTNILVGNDPARIISAAGEVLDGNRKPARGPRLWDGKAANRILEVLLRWQRTPPENPSDVGFGGA